MDQNHLDCSHEQAILNIFSAVKSGLLSVVQNIVNESGEGILNSFDEKGNTPCHWASLSGHKELVEWIIKRGAWFNEPGQNEQGQRPIHWAAYKGHCPVVELLLQNGVSIDIQDSKGKTPLIVSTQAGKCSVAAFLIAKGASKGFVDSDGDGPLHWAAYNGHAEMARMLVYFGYDPEQPDLHFQRPIHLASIKGNAEVVRDLCNIDKVNTRVVDKNGATPLVLAARKGHSVVVAYLKMVESRNKKFSLPSSFRSILDGSYLAGSNKKLFIFLTILILLFGYPAYIFECVPTTWNELFTLHLLFIVFNSIFWVTFIKTHFLDPGYLPLDGDGSYVRIMKNISSFGEIDDTTAALGQLCHTCRIVKPLRSKHCRICNRCVKEMDHHCYYVGNCVGLKNRVWFLFFVFSCLVICLISVTFCYYLHATSRAGAVIYVGWLMLMVFGTIAFIIFTCIIHTAFTGLTTNERNNWSRYKYLQDSDGKLSNPYDKGTILGNMADYFRQADQTGAGDIEKIVGFKGVFIV